MKALKYKRHSIVGILILILISIFGYYDNQVSKTQTPSPVSTSHRTAKDKELVALLKSATTTQYFKVDKVVDGDTFEVSVDGGIATLRLIGINTPETVDPRKPVECFGREASTRAHALLDGQAVSLTLDPTQDNLDKYGRVLAYAYLPSGDLYNKKMIQDGYAYEYTYNVPYQFQAKFKADQALAQKQGKGLWATSTCSGKK